MGKALTVTVATAFAVAAFGFGVSVSAVLDTVDDPAELPWRFPLALGLLAGGLVLIVLALVRLVRLRNRYIVAAWRGLNRGQRRYAARQLRGEHPVGPHQVDFLRALARQRREQRVMALQQAGLALVGSGQAVSGDTVWQLALGLTVAALTVVALTALSNDVSNMGNFLDRHGWVGPSPAPT